MLVFIIPLKSPQVSKSWDRVTRLFERSVKSVCNQTSDNFKVIVVCHEKPVIEFSHPHVTYIEVDPINFPLPSQEGAKKVGLDKFRKILVGVKKALPLEPSHIMQVDADDCVSKHLAEFVEQNPQSNGWFVNSGYVYPDGSRFIYYRRKKFYLSCGTCNIIRTDLLDLPENLEDYRFDYLIKYQHSHRDVVKKLAGKGTPIAPLPFPGAVYITDHGENTPSGNAARFFQNKGLANLKKILSLRPLTHSIRNEFGLYHVTSTMAVPPSNASSYSFT